MPHGLVKETPGGKNGQPTTDAETAFAGTVLPVGGVKGAMLALIVESLAYALTGVAFGFEADSFSVDEGNEPRLGQLFLAVDPGALAGSDRYFARTDRLIELILQDEGVRLPDERRRTASDHAIRQAVGIPDDLHLKIAALAGEPHA